MDLADLQRRFARAVTHGDGDGDSCSFEANLRYGARFKMYRDGYPLRVYEALIEAFPRTFQLLGDERSLELVTAFARGSVLAGFDLSTAGEGLESFLGDPDLGLPPYVSCLAHVEWIAAQVFHARRVVPLSMQDLAQGLSSVGGDFVVGLQPHVRLTSTPWSILDLLCDPLGTCPAGPQISYYLVYRKLHGGTRVEGLDRGQFDLLSSLTQRVPLSIALSALECQSGETLPAHQWIAGWIEAGLVVDGMGLGSTSAAQHPSPTFDAL